MQRKICALFEQGHTVSAVCGAVGIGERTFYEWREKHPHFSQATSRAIGQSRIALVDKVRLSDDWRAQAFLLERRWANEFGRTEPRVIQASPAPVSSDAADYGKTAGTLRILLTKALAAFQRDEAKIARLRETLNDVEVENARLVRFN